MTRTRETDRYPLPQRLVERFLAVAIARLSAVGGTARANACVKLPDEVLLELCRRLLDRRQAMGDAARWLRGVQTKAPTKSSVFRFAAVLYREFRAAADAFAARGGGA
jgi:hypothetical protein